VRIGHNNEPPVRVLSGGSLLSTVDNETELEYSPSMPGHISGGEYDLATNGKNTRPNGVTPAVALTNPRFDHNVGAARSASSCFGVYQIWFTYKRSFNGVSKC
jgi:hypothetical protein